MKRQPSGDDPEKLMEQIRHYCAYQERCNQEVEQKLKAWHVAPQKIRTILIHLTREGFLHEERFARAYARGRFRGNKWGKYRIIQELRARRIPDTIIEEAMTEIGMEEYVMVLRGLILKKIQESGGENLNLRKKILTFATGKGYEPALILNLLNEMKIQR